MDEYTVAFMPKYSQGRDNLAAQLRPGVKRNPLQSPWGTLLGELLVGPELASLTKLKSLIGLRVRGPVTYAAKCFIRWCALQFGKRGVSKSYGYDEHHYILDSECGLQPVILDRGQQRIRKRLVPFLVDEYGCDSVRTGSANYETAVHWIAQQFIKDFHHAYQTHQEKMRLQETMPAYKKRTQRRMRLLRSKFFTEYDQLLEEFHKTVGDRLTEKFADTCAETLLKECVAQFVNELNKQEAAFKCKKQKEEAARMRKEREKQRRKSLQEKRQEATRAQQAREQRHRDTQAYWELLRKHSVDRSLKVVKLAKGAVHPGYRGTVLPLDVDDDDYDPCDELQELDFENLTPELLTEGLRILRMDK